MATVADVRREREQPIVAVIELTENELKRAFDSAVYDEVAAQRASDLALTDVGAASVYTLADKLRAAYRTPSEPSKGGGTDA